MILKFSDGETFDTSCELKKELREDGWYVIGNGWLIPVPNEHDAEKIINELKITRFEVIDENGRVYVAKDCKVELSYQDDGKTLKVFIKNKNKQ